MFFVLKESYESPFFCRLADKASPVRLRDDIWTNQSSIYLAKELPSKIARAQFMIR